MPYDPLLSNPPRWHRGAWGSHDDGLLGDGQMPHTAPFATPPPAYEPKPVDLKQAVFSDIDPPLAPLYGGIEYLEAADGRLMFHDINANSNLRPSVAAAFGFDPFERVVTFLESALSGMAAAAR